MYIKPKGDNMNDQKKETNKLADSLQKSGIIEFDETNESNETNKNSVADSDVNMAPYMELTQNVTIDAYEKTVIRKHKTDTDILGKLDCIWEFDFKNCTKADLYELASRSVLIAYRPQFKKLGESELEKAQVQRIDVGEFVKNGMRKTKSKVEKASTIVGQMTESEKAELLKLLNA